MIREDRELLAGLAQAHTAMPSLDLRIMDNSASAAEGRSDCANMSDPAHPVHARELFRRGYDGNTPVTARPALSRVGCAASVHLTTAGVVLRHVQWAVADLDREPASRVTGSGSPRRDGGSRNSAISALKDHHSRRSSAWGSPMSSCGSGCSLWPRTPHPSHQHPDPRSAAGQRYPRIGSQRLQRAEPVPHNRPGYHRGRSWSRRCGLPEGACLP
jgi:hypothetical protein